MVGGHVTQSLVRRALALALALLLVAVGLISGAPSAQALVPTSIQTFQGRFGSYDASTSFMTAACSVSASATINLPTAPAGATIDTAYLLWAASGNTADTTATVNGTPVTGVAVTDFFDPTEGYFQTRANITSLVTTAGGAFTIADITSATGAPWCTYSTVMKSATIYVFYEDPAEPVSQLNFYSGLEIIYGSETTVNVSHGPLAPAAIGEIQVLLYEGDAGLSGSRNGFRERFRVNGTVTSSGDNQWNSSTGIAIDMDTMAVPAGALTAGATSTQIRMSSGNDFVLLSSFILESQIQAADIAVTKTIDDPQPDPGDTVTYTVTATNNGVNTSTGVEVTDLVPAGLTFASAATTQGTYTSGTGVWGVGTLASGASETLTVTATVDAGTVGNTILNTATKTGGSGFDVDTTNNSATATLTVRGANLAVTKAVDNTLPNPGDTITYTVTATNNGPSDTTGVVISDTLPAGLTLVSSSATTGVYGGSTWTIGSLAASSAATLTLVATVDAGTAGSDIINTAFVTGNDLVDPVPADNSDSVSIRVPIVDIAVAKVTSNTTPLPGDTFTYTVTATNSGPDAATGVAVDDVIPSGLNLTGVSATAGSYASDTWTIGSLGSGASESIVFSVAVPTGSTGGIVTNTAVVSAVNETESSTANNSASATATIAQSDIAITKTVNVPTPNPGDPITYTVTVTNNGPDTATGVSVTDTLPAGVTEIGSSTTQGSYTASTWTVGTLASGSAAILTINATVNAGTAGTTQSNAATGTSDQADPNSSNNGDTADIVVPAVDVAITKTVNNAAPNPGDTITYTVSVANNGPDAATAVTIADAVPSGVTLVSASPSQGGYVGGIWTVGTILNGANATLTLIATVDVGTAGSTITNVASLTSVTETDTDGTNDSDSASIGVPAVDLTMTKTVSAPNPNPGQTVTYTVTVANNGPDTATGISISDTVPTGLIITGSSATQGSYGTSVWNVGVLANGASATLTITAVISASTVGTTVANTAAVSAVAETDVDLSNDSDSTSFSVPAVDLAVTKTVSDPAPNPGDTIAYVVTVTNNGPDTATGVSLSDALPAGVSYTSASATQGSYTAPTWSVGTLVSGASATLTITVAVLSTAAGTTVTNSASAATVDQTDTNTSNDSASAAFSAPAIDLDITKTVDAPIANPGDTVTFSIVATNNGPDTATGVSITDALPVGVTFVSAATTGGSYSAPIWTVGGLASGATETLTIVATVDLGTAGTTIVNTASTASSNETDVVPSNDSDTASVTVPSADLMITKIVDDSNPLPGDTITYTVTVTNGGPSAATGISISDPLPAGITLVSATATQGSFTEPNWMVGSLGNGAAATLSIVATVDAGTPGSSIANTASVTTLNETDPNTSNDSATSTIYVSAVDIAVTKTVDTALAQVGDAVSYTVTVTNNGPDTASGVTINDSVPSGVTLVSALFSQGSYAAGVWTVGNLPSGATETLTLNVTVNASSAGSTVTNTASFGTADQTDTDSSNNTDSAAFGVPAVDIAISKTVDNPTPIPGATVTYTVTATNLGPSPASVVSVSDALPAGITLVSASPSQGSYAGSTWTIGTLGGGSSVTLTLVATVDAGTAGSTITNTAGLAGVLEYDVDTSNDTDSATIVVSAVDLSLTKTVDDPAPDPGDTITFTVTVSNAGPEIATGVSIADALPSGLTLVTATPSQGAFVGSTWTVGVLGIGSSATLTMVVTVNAGTAGTSIANTASVASVNQIDIDPTNDTASATINVPLTDISVAKSVDDTTPNPGDTITYTITASNLSTDDATGVVITDVLPAGVTLGSASATQGSFVGSIWTVGTVSASASAILTLVATVDAGTAGSTLTNTATLTNVNETESNVANNTASADISVNAVDLGISKTVSNGAPNPGDTITYTVTVSNTGPSSATGVTVTDTLPGGVTLVSAAVTSGTYAGSTWTVGTVASGASATLTITATVDAGTAGSTISNMAAVATVTETDTNSSNDADSAAFTVPAIDLAVAKVADNATPNEGDTVIFTVTVTNSGPDSATGVVIADPLPAGFTATSSLASIGTYAAGAWVLGPLASGATETLSIAGTINTGAAGTTITNTASVAASNETDTIATNNIDSASVTVKAVDLAVTKAVDNATPNPGDTIVYTVVVGNTGPNVATGVSLTDALPGGVTLVSVSASQGSYTSPTWTVGSLSNGTAATLTVTATVDPGTEGSTISNAAALASVTETDTDPTNDSAIADVVVQLVDVAISKAVDNATPNPGDLVTYTIVIANGGPDTASGVAINDALPTGVSLTSATATQGAYSGVTWTIGTLTNGQSETLTIMATIDTGTEGATITNTASITAVSETESDLLNNSASVDITVNAVDLAVTKTVSNPAPNPGDAVSYTVTVTNNGPDTATGISLTDNLPAGVTLAGTSTTQGSYVGSTWTLGTLSSGSAATLTINVTLDAGTAGSTITNIASVSGVTETDTDPSNDSAAAALSVPAVDVAVTKTVDDAAPNEGDTIIYTVDVANNGPDAATGVEITDVLPAGVTLVSAGTTQGSLAGSLWSVGTLANSTTATLTITASVDAGTAGTVVVNSASVTGIIETDTDPTNDSDSAAIDVPGVNLVVAKSVNDTTPNPGDSVTYTIQVTNGGPDTATGVALVDALPTGVTLISASMSQGSYTEPIWTVGSIANGTTATLTIVATIDTGTEGTAILNTATVSSINETDTNPTNNTDSVSINVPAVDVTITKIADTATANPGDTVTFTITAANAGPDIATGVVVTDVLPVGLTLVSATPSLGSVTGSTWTVGGLGAGASTTLALVATVDSGTAGTTITNTATLTAVNEVDTDPSNDSDSTAITVNAIDLEVTKAVSNATPNPGDATTYTVTVTNNGPDTATSVAITDSLPAGVTLVSASTTQGAYVGATWTVGTLVSGTSATLTIDVIVDSGTAGSLITNTASVATVTETDTEPTNDSDAVIVSVPAIDLAIVKTVDNATPTEGDPITYTVVATNNGPDAATGIVVTDTLPAGTTLVSTSATQGSVAGTVWSVGSLADAGSATLTIIATVDNGTAGTVLTNVASLSASSETDTNSANNADTAAVTVSAVDLAITKTVDTPTAQVGDTVTFTVVVTNAGPDAATSVTVADLLPAGLTYTSGSPSQGGYVSASGVWTVGTIASGADATLIMTATIDPGTPGMTLTNTANASGSTETDTNPANDSASASVIVPAVDIAVTKSVDAATANPGDPLTYTITVTNNGPDSATGIEITDSLPPGVTVASTSTSQGTLSGPNWVVGSLGAAGTATLTYNVTVDPGTAGVTITNTASLSNVSQDDTNSANDSASVSTTVNAVDLAITKTASTAVANEGDVITYTVTITNNGPDTATGVTISDTLPPGVTLVGTSVTQGTYAASTWTIGSLANGASATLAITAAVDTGTAGTVVTNIASLDAVTETDTDPSNNSASAGFSVNAVDLAIAKTVDVATADAGDTVVYTITVTNNGPDPATGVAIADALPPAITLASASATQGAFGASTWIVGALASGATETLTISATVNPGTAGTTITNTASLASVAEADTDPSNNSANAGFSVNAVDLAVTKTADVAVANAGDAVTYMITIINSGPDTATGVAVTDVLPGGITTLTSTTSQGSASGSVWTVGTLASGGAATWTIVTTVDPGSAGSTITNTATLTNVTETDTAPGNDADSAGITIPLVDVAITKTVDSAAANPGDTLTYTVTATNLGPDSATNIAVTDVLPSTLTLGSTAATQGAVAGSTWTIASLASGASETLTIVATVDLGTAGSTITNTASVGAIDEADGDPTNDADSAATSVRAVDIAVTKTADTALANPGEAVTYTITATNGGPDAATGIVVADALPPGVTFGSATPSQGTYIAASWNLGTLAAGSSATLTIVATVDPGTAGSTITNTATLASVVETDTEPSNDSDVAGFDVPAIDLLVTKIVDNVSPNPGENVTYTVSVTNSGPSTASNVLIGDTLPAGLTLTSAATSQGAYVGTTWSVGTLLAGNSATLSLVASVNAGTSGTTITNTAAVVGSTEVDIDPSNDSASAELTVPAVNLIVAKSVSDTSPNPGDTITYTVQVTNGGPDTATGVALVDTLPAGVTAVSTSTTQGSYAAPAWTIGTLLSGSTVTLSLVATVDAGTENSTIVNTASVSSLNETDTNPTNNSANASIAIPAVDLSVVKTVDAPTANPGDTVTFTVTVSNAGPDDATGVALADAIPAGMTLVSTTSSIGSYVGSTWTIGSVGAGAAEALTVVATVNAGTAGSMIVNTASILTVTETDTSTSNDSDTASVTINAVDVSISKTVNDTTPNVGDIVTYTVTVTNGGPDTATGVTVSEPLPGGMTLISMTPSQGSAIGSSWTIGSLVSGASATLLVTASVDAGTGGTTITNTVSLAGVTEQDVNPSNDTASASLTPQSVDLSIDKSVDVANAAPGDTATFTVTLTNAGPDTATGIVVDDVLPGGLTAISTTPSLGTWTAPQWSVPTLPAGSSTTLVFVAVIGPGLWNQTFTNTASVTVSDQEDSDTANDSDVAIVTTAPSADLAVSKSVDNASPNAGDEILYTITITNNGPDDEPTALVTDALPIGVAYVSDSASVGIYNSASGVWTVGLLANGATATLTISAVVAAGYGTTTITNTAVASGTLVDTEPANDQATVDITPTLVDVAISKTAPTSTTAGSTIAYSIVVSNSGPDTATGVAVTDVLPASVTYIGSAASVGSYDPATGVWNVGDLSNAATATLTITVGVGATTPVTNTATVAATGTEDADPTNNTSSVTTNLLLPPVAGDDVAATPFDTPVVIPILGNDTDPDGTIDPTSVVIATDPANGTVVVDPVTGDLTYTPDADFSGADIFEYAVCDNDGLCATASVFVTIDPENDAPFPFERDGDGDPLPVGVITYTIAVGETPDPLPLIDPNDDNIISLVIVDGALAPGLLINPDGSFSGAATTIGTYTVQIEICDDGTPQRCSLFLVTIRVGETLPYTGLEVVGFVRLGLMFILGGAILLLLAWKREEEENQDGNAPMVS